MAVAGRRSLLWLGHEAFILFPFFKWGKGLCLRRYSFCRCLVVRGVKFVVRSCCLARAVRSYVDDLVGSDGSPSWCARARYGLADLCFELCSFLNDYG